MRKLKRRGGRSRRSVVAFNCVCNYCWCFCQCGMDPLENAGEGIMQNNNDNMWYGQAVQG